MTGPLPPGSDPPPASKCSSPQPLMTLSCTLIAQASTNPFRQVQGQDLADTAWCMSLHQHDLLPSHHKRAIWHVVQKACASLSHPQDCSVNKTLLTKFYTPRHCVVGARNSSVSKTHLTDRLVHISLCISPCSPVFHASSLEMLISLFSGFINTFLINFPMQRAPDLFSCQVFTYWG